MMPILIIVALIASGAVAWLYNRNRHLLSSLSQSEAECFKLQSRIDTLNEEVNRIVSERDSFSALVEKLRDDNSSISIEKAKLDERLVSLNKEINRLSSEAEARFNTLAQAVLENKAKVFKEENETRLSEILAPFKDNVEALKREINEKYVAEGKERSMLTQHINSLMEMNVTLGREARELSSALRGNSKVQGDWGEFILKSLLERSGLVEGENFSMQVSRDKDGAVMRTESGNMLRPDVVLYLPDGKNLVIDSKVSLTNYINYVNSDDEEERDRYYSLHQQSVKSHINELKAKRYQDYVGQTGNFVMMFIPNEGAFLAALRAKSNLLQYAYDSHVVLLSPSNLMATVELVRQIWQHDKQTKNAITIAEEAGKLYDKFVGLHEDLTKIGKAMETASQAYESSMKKLSLGNGNLLGRVEKLKEMGAKATKSLPQPK